MKRKIVKEKFPLRNIFIRLLYFFPALLICSVILTLIFYLIDNITPIEYQIDSLVVLASIIAFTLSADYSFRLFVTEKRFKHPNKKLASFDTLIFLIQIFALVIFVSIISNGNYSNVKILEIFPLLSGLLTFVIIVFSEMKKFE